MSRNFMLIVSLFYSVVQASNYNIKPDSRNKQNNNPMSNAMEDSTDPDMFNINITNQPNTTNSMQQQPSFVPTSCSDDKKILRRLQGPIGKLLKKIFLTQRDAYQLIQFYDTFYQTDDDLFIISLLSFLKAIHLYNYKVPAGTPMIRDYIVVPNLNDIANLLTAFVAQRKLVFNDSALAIFDNFTPCSFNYVFINASILYYTLLTGGPNTGFIVSKDNLSTTDLNNLSKLIFKYYTQMYNMYQNLVNPTEPTTCIPPQDNNTTPTMNPQTYMYALMDFFKFISSKNPNQTPCQDNTQTNENETEYCC